MLSEAQTSPTEANLIEFSTLDLIRAMLHLQRIDYEIVKHGKLIHVFAKNVVIVISEWARPLDSRTLFNILKRVEGKADKVLLITRKLSEHAKETIVRRRLPVVLIPNNEVLGILDYLS